MSSEPDKKPLVLVFAGHDPSGGAGIQADIEAIVSAGCHAATVITSLTAQNTAEFRNAYYQDPAHFQEQIELILADMQIDACKIGLINDLTILASVEKVLFKLPGIPVVLDPVINAGTGEKIMTENIRNALHEKLLPFTTVITPNSIEARELTGRHNLDDAASEIIKKGCHAVLITGTHEDSDKVINTLYIEKEKPLKFEWERLPAIYHGSGCTLSSCIAAHLGLGADIKTAVARAQSYTWNTLKHGFRLGRKQLHPDRFYWKTK